MDYLEKTRVCSRCGGEMAPLCDLEADRPRQGDAGIVADCAWTCLACGERTHPVFIVSRRRVCRTRASWPG